MSADILVVFKKNFESVHDRAMDQIQSDLEQLVKERGIRAEFTAREKVRHSDFIGHFGNSYMIDSHFGKDADAAFRKGT